MDPLDPGHKVRDAHGGRAGVVLDIARQYSHPKAQPVHNYLIRWEDGQVEAVSEMAFARGGGIELDD
jgi:hypothetical protein